MTQANCRAVSFDLCANNPWWFKAFERFFIIMDFLAYGALGILIVLLPDLLKHWSS